MQHLKIVSTSDVHGYLYPTNYSHRHDLRDYGWLRAATLLRQLQRADANDITLTIDNGDWIQGSALASYLATQAPQQAPLFSQLLNAAHYDVGVLGNHEFNYGLDYLRTAQAARHYPLLSANIEGAQAQAISDAPYQIIEKQGVKIAVLGLTTAHVPSWEAARHITGLTFRSALATAQEWVPKLHQLADVVVVAYHGGFEADLTTGYPTEPLTNENEGYRLLSQVPGIDALVTGHQHRQIAGIYQQVPVTQPGDKAVAVGLIDLTLDTQHQVVDHAATLLPTANVALDPTLVAQTQSLETQVQRWLDHPVGQLTGASMAITDPFAARQHHHPYLAFINQVEMAAGQTDIAATALFNDDVLGLQPTVTRRQVLNSYAYPNTLVVEEITGVDLRAALEQCASFFTVTATGQIGPAPTKTQLFNYDVYSGIDYTFDLSQPVGQRLVRLLYHDAPVRPDQKLQVAMNQYRGNGGGEYPMFRPSKIIREVNQDMASLIQDYLQTHPVVTGMTPTNLTIHA
ncbi:bifunctional metallophosphatase/5'-nucleotidase [Levilactobacillus zymae]|uniref:bifunctional metallophosphatase/5'-nucleotidase n=1 Tax=Levilactobacillus zymae TaxID=267363 RepID=UPI0028B458A1|nr:bifunctional metallophosphatase/5'-nucleotidase [Levilactobacillus zymae]MDT6979630.1 bifunctional metallophosphatase/5'-nucleotidase [Levilactobacillus zymae]